MTVRAFYVTWPEAGPDFHMECNARSAGAARYEFLLSLRDAGYEVSFKDLRVKRIGAPRSSDRLLRVAAYRGRPELVAGTRVLCDGALGTVLDGDSSANFVVEFDPGSPYAGRCSVHPADLVVVGATS